MKWYVLFTQYHHERAEYERLLCKAFQPYLPFAVVWLQANGQGQVLIVRDAEIRLLRQLSDSGSSLQRTVYKLRGRTWAHRAAPSARDLRRHPRDTRTTLLVPIHLLQVLQASVSLEIGQTQVTPCMSIGE